MGVCGIQGVCLGNKGIRFEHEVKNMYKDDGYRVIRASASHGDFDLIVWCRLHEIHIACQINGFSSKEFEKWGNYKELPAGSIIRLHWKEGKDHQYWEIKVK